MRWGWDEKTDNKTKSLLSSKKREVFAQENKELMRYIEKNLFGEVQAVAAGGYHNVII